MNAKTEGPTGVAEQTGNSAAKRGRLGHPWLPFIVAVVAAVVLFIGLRYLAHAFSHESTDDAFIETHVVSVAPKISGQVSAVYVLDNEIVHTGDLLVEIDPHDYDAKLAQKQASGETANANLKTVFSLVQLMDARLESAQAGARQSHAEVDVAVATAKRAQSELDRFAELVTNRAVAQQEFENVQATQQEAAANLKAKQQAAEQSDSQVDEAKAQYKTAAAGVDLARAQIKAADADEHSAGLDVSYTKIYAPTDGRVTRKSVEVGNYLQVGQPLLALVATDVWVVANFKETQLMHMRTNQFVDVDLEATGQQHLRAHVQSFQAGSGAQFSLLPPENAVGNFVKVVQRVPVKIVFDESVKSELVIGPGMSVVPTVEIGKQFPSWALALIALVLAFIVFLVVTKLVNRKKPSAPTA